MLLVPLHSVKVSEVLPDLGNLVISTDFTFYKSGILATVYIAYSKCLCETVLFIPCSKLTFALCHNGASHTKDYLMMLQVYRKKF